MRQQHASEHRTKNFVVQKISVLRRGVKGDVDALAQRVGPAEQFGHRVALTDILQPLPGAGVIGNALRRLRQRLLDQLLKSGTKFPARAEQHQLTGCAVKAAVLQFLRSDCLRLVLQIGFVPGPGDDDGRGDSAEFGMNGPRVLRRPSPFAITRVVAHAPDDGVVNGFGTGDMNGLHQRVRAEVGAELGAPLDDPHKAQIDGGLQHGRKIRQHVFVDRVELEDADLVFGQQLVQNVQWRNRRHIAGAQHQGDFSFAVGLGRVVSLCCVAGEVVGADPGLHPNLGANAA